jgi:hypothetical protein
MPSKQLQFESLPLKPQTRPLHCRGSSPHSPFLDDPRRTEPEDCQNCKQPGHHHTRCSQNPKKIESLSIKQNAVSNIALVPKLQSELEMKDKTIKSLE